jgi:ABC-2 type transport system ATP-binding protein
VPIAQIEGLTVRYRRFEALSNFSVDIPEGSIGLLGPNGAGKTTLLKTLLGFLEPAAGGGQVLGKEIGKQNREIRQLIGFMPEQDCHIPGMTAVEFVAYAGELGGLPTNQAIRRAHEVIEYAGLGEARYRKIESYSTGMKQRIKLAQALVHGPKLLLLDEPTNGLDPKGRQEMLSLIGSIARDRHVNVLVSSHLLPDIERTCDQVILMMQGQLKAQGTIRDLKRIEGQPIDVDLRENPMPLVEAATKHGLDASRIGEHRVRLIANTTPAETIRLAFSAAKDAGLQIRRAQAAERSLEEAFMEAVNG